MRNKFWLSLGIAVYASCLSVGIAQSPALIHYQGRLVDGTNLVNGTVGLTLRLFDASSGGTMVYADSNQVMVVNGLYATQIGDGTIAGNLDSALINAQVWLEAVVNGTVMTPRERLVSVPYARAVHGLLFTTQNSAIINPQQANIISTLSARSVIGGGFNNEIAGAALEATISGGSGNSIISPGATIGGGVLNQATGQYAVVAGGFENQAVFRAFVAGGWRNVARGSYGAVSGGRENIVTQGAAYGVIGGGWSNLVTGTSATIAGGSTNRATGDYAAIGGGMNNRAEGSYSTVPGGRDNTASATYSFAAGRRAKATHSGSLVWADGQNSDFTSVINNEVAVRAGGGVRMDLGDSPGIMLNAVNRALITRGWDAFTGGVHQAAGRWGLFMETSRLVIGIPDMTGREFHVGRYNPDSTYTSLVRVTQSGDLYTLGTVNPPSDRNLKQDFTSVDGRDILARLTAMPMHTWAYRNNPDVRHIGPTAQDFQAAFGVGASDTSIATVDADGVALAAIQALAKRNEELMRENEALRAEVEAIKRTLGM